MNVHRPSSSRSLGPVKASNHPFRDKRIYARALPQAGANAIKYVKACSRQLHAGKAELIWAGAESERNAPKNMSPRAASTARDLRNRRIPDMVWYVLTGLLVLAGIWLFVIYVPRSKFPPRKWTEFVFYSSFLFYVLCRFYWRYRSRAGLWKWMVAVLAIHLCIYIPVLAHIEVMPAIRLWRLRICADNNERREHQVHKLAMLTCTKR